MSFFVRLINLDRSPDRLASFRRQNPDLPFERVAAVDGQLLDRDEQVRAGLIAANNFFSPAAIGLLATHVRLWRACAQETEPFHIAEDDVIFRRDFVRVAAAALGELGEWDIVFWGFNLDWPIEIELSAAVGRSVMVFDQDALRMGLEAFRDEAVRPALARLTSCAGTAAYSISPAGARRYLERCLPVGNAPARHVTSHARKWRNTGLDVEMCRHHAELRAFIALPPLAASPNDHAQSTIRGIAATGANSGTMPPAAGARQTPG